MITALVMISDAKSLLTRRNRPEGAGGKRRLFGMHISAGSGTRPMPHHCWSHMVGPFPARRVTDLVEAAMGVHPDIPPMRCGFTAMTT